MGKFASKSTMRPSHVKDSRLFQPIVEYRRERERSRRRRLEACRRSATWCFPFVSCREWRSVFRHDRFLR